MSRHIQIKESISVDGLDMPVMSLYFSYCDKKDITGSFCPNCHNAELQKDGVGYRLSYHDVIELVDRKIKYWEETLNKEVGVCFLGGEPLASKNRDMVMKLSDYYKDRFQIAYTWKEKKQVDEEWIKHIDKIVCGVYVDELKNEDYLLGSTNQYIINSNKNIILKYKEG